jgi:hypothetical protein
MRPNWFRAVLRTAIPLTVLGLCRLALTQDSIALLQPEAMHSVPLEPTYTVNSTRPKTLPDAPDHRFWDRTNSVLFATNAVLTTADFVVTRDNLRTGHELNPVTRIFSGSTAGLAVNFAGETVGTVGLSYLFHKTGHHRLERAVSMLNIGSSAAAVTFSLAHR